MQPDANSEKLIHQWVIEGRGVRLELGRRTLVMGVLNVTPDSFSDGGPFLSVERAVEHAQQMVGLGADIIDVGGESSRPGSDPISVQEELSRVIPVIEQVVKQVSVPISVDTYKAEVAQGALSAGAHIINDISALRHDPQMAGVAARSGAPVILMHMQGSPKTMQKNPTYRSVINDIKRFFKERLRVAQSAGIQLSKTILDPGIGFGKELDHNLEILRSLNELRTLKRPLLIGPSRKSFIGQILGLSVRDRVEGTMAVALAAVFRGASIVRVHDVKEMVRAVRVNDAIRFGVDHGA